MTSVSTIFLTYNEEQDLPRALEAAKELGPVFVVDSGSADKTVEIAEALGAKVYSNPFKSFGTQRNWALDNLPVSSEWVLFLDADEVAPTEFRQALLETLAKSSSDTAGYYCCWKLILENKWLRFSDNFPKWQFRLLRKNRARFTDFGHGQKEGEVAGIIEYLREPYLHYAFSKGWEHWIAKHNSYATKEAAERLGNLPPLKTCLSRHGSKRNPALKSWLSRIPGWPSIRFVYTYFLRGGFREGMPGLIYAKQMAFFEFQVQLRMRELRDKE